MNADIIPYKDKIASIGTLKNITERKLADMEKHYLF